MLIFYDVALSPFAQKVKIALKEKAIPYETRHPALGENDPELLAANPRVEVPALKDGDVVVFDSSIVLDYLEDKWPEPALRPADPAGRARVRMLEEICDSQFEAIIWGLNEVIAFNRAEGREAERVIAHGGEEIGRLRDWLTLQLGDRDWFTGDSFGLGDIAVLPYLMTARLFRFGPAEGSPLAAWLDRMLARLSVHETLAEAKMALPAFRELGAKFASGEAKRQYRDHRLEFLLRAGGFDIVRRGMENDTIRFSSLPG